MKRFAKFVIALFLIVSCIALAMEIYLDISLLTDLESNDAGIVLGIIFIFPIVLMGDIGSAVISLISLIVSSSVKHSLVHAPDGKYEEGPLFDKTVKYFKVTQVLSLILFILAVACFAGLIIGLKLSNGNSGSDIEETTAMLSMLRNYIA